MGTIKAVNPTDKWKLLKAAHLVRPFFGENDETGKAKAVYDGYEVCEGFE